MVRKQPKDSRKCIMEKHKYVGTLKAYQQKCTSSLRSQRTFSVGSHCRSHFFDRSIQSKRAHTRYNLKCVFMGILCGLLELSTLLLLLWFQAHVIVIILMSSSLFVSFDFAHILRYAESILSFQFFVFFFFFGTRAVLLLLLPLLQASLLLPSYHHTYYIYISVVLIHFYFICMHVFSIVQMQRTYK